ncbi:serine/threonine-protein kinase [Mycolicibacterium llatzerense]|uniref:serine/threonine-protein kinase n=1 Tax=Mycolicibacterium llatzerense TaxID=280871 RepID=UPI0021B5883C|nr:serine/threonine-protein kinase [Mycolicibacterium llatzerense]MCT7369131.1 protein kinase [Mycolicibacterium llatzerense]
MPAPGVLADRYQLRGTLGRGGMAEVRDAWDTQLQRPVAVKLLYAQFSDQPDFRRRFQVEARAAAGLNHPHVVAVHDYGEQDGTPYIVMERLPGRTLADAIAAGPLPQDLVRSVLDGVLSALAMAHAAGILHRDIKPGNILLADSGAAKLADFGIAKSADSNHTVAGQVVGTMGYLSADRLSGRPATVADDLYAVGVVGYEALTGRRPFPQDNLVALARAVADGQPVPLHALRPDAEPALAVAVERAMTRDPRMRFTSADEMRAVLSGAVPIARPQTMVLGQPLPDPTTSLLPVVAPRRRSRILLWGAAAIAVLVTVIAVIVDAASRPSGPPAPVGTSTTESIPTSTSAPPLTSTSTSAVDAPPSTGPGNGRGKGPKNKHHGD